MSIPSFQAVLKKYPALWDINDFNYGDRNIRKKLIQKLVKECNRYSNPKLSEADVTLKLRLFKRRLRFHEQKTVYKEKKPPPPAPAPPQPSSAPSIPESASKWDQRVYKSQPEVIWKQPSPRAASPTPSTSSWSRSAGSSVQGGSSNKTLQHYIATFGSSASTDFPNISKVLPQCRFCAKFSTDCIDLCTDNGDSVKNNITIVFNEVSVFVDLNSRELPRTVCRECDVNLQDMYKFVNRVHDAQKSLIRVCDNVSAATAPVIKEETEDSEDGTDNDLNFDTFVGTGANDELEVSETKPVLTNDIPKTITGQRQEKVQSKKLEVIKSRNEMLIESDIKEEYNDVNVRNDFSPPDRNLIYKPSDSNSVVIVSDSLKELAEFLDIKGRDRTLSQY